LKNVSFDFDELTRSSAGKPQSLTESMINILGFNSLDVEDDKNEMVASRL
jgi:hypothetical protein